MQLDEVDQALELKLKFLHYQQKSRVFSLPFSENGSENTLWNQMFLSVVILLAIPCLVLLVSTVVWHSMLQPSKLLLVISINKMYGRLFSFEICWLYNCFHLKSVEILVIKKLPVLPFYIFSSLLG